MRLANLRHSRGALFWSLHAMGWCAWGLSHYLGALLHEKEAGYAKVIATGALSGFVLSAPLRLACRALWSRRPAVMIGGALLCAYVAALTWRVSVNIAYASFMPADAWMHLTSFTDFFSGTISAMYLMSCWIGLYFGFRYYESMTLQREAVLRSSALAQEAQLKMLRYQLNPHFLFNTLNAISTLILDNRNATANSAVTGLSEFLRYTLDQDPMKRVTVAQEVEALNLYLKIEKMRFGDRLKIEFAVDDAAASVLMPSLLLQPLIENAIKYAVSPREEGGVIRIGARVIEGQLQLEVADNGPGLIDASRVTNGRGVGLRNTRERLQVLYAERGGVDVRSSGSGLCIVLNFPAERSAD